MSVFYYIVNQVRTVLSPLDLRTNPVALVKLMALWSDRIAVEQTTGQSDHFHTTGDRRWWVDNNNTLCKHEVSLTKAFLFQLIQDGTSDWTADSSRSQRSSSLACPDHCHYCREGLTLRVERINSTP